LRFKGEYFYINDGLFHVDLICQFRWGFYIC